MNNLNSSEQDGRLSLKIHQRESLDFLKNDLEDCSDQSRSDYSDTENGDEARRSNLGSVLQNGHK